MKHDEFQVERHGFGNEARALLRVNLRGAFFVSKILYSGSQLLQNSKSNFGEKHHG